MPSSVRHNAYPLYDLTCTCHIRSIVCASYPKVTHVYSGLLHLVFLQTLYALVGCLRFELISSNISHAIMDDESGMSWRNTMHTIPIASQQKKHHSAAVRTLYSLLEEHSHASSSDI